MNITRLILAIAFLSSFSEIVKAQEISLAHDARVNSNKSIFETEFAGYCVNMAQFFSETAQSLAKEPGLKTVSKNALAKDVGRFNVFVASAVRTFELCNQYFRHSKLNELDEQ